MHGTPEIFNTDEGSQFNSLNFTGALKSQNIRISMDGKGRAIYNVFIERLWRSMKYEYANLNPVNVGVELYRRMNKYISFHNHERPHQTYDYKTPSELFFDQQNVV